MFLVRTMTVFRYFNIIRAGFSGNIFVFRDSSFVRLLHQVWKLLREVLLTIVSSPWEPIRTCPSKLLSCRLYGEILIHLKLHTETVSIKKDQNGHIWRWLLRVSNLTLQSSYSMAYPDFLKRLMTAISIRYDATGRPWTQYSRIKERNGDIVY